MPALQDEDAGVRRGAAEAIGYVFSAAKEPLNPETRAVAVDAICHAIAKGHMTSFEAYSVLKGSVISDAALQPFLGKAPNLVFNQQHIGGDRCLVGGITGDRQRRAELD